MNDYLKTIFLLSFLSIIVIFLGGIIGGRSGLYMALIISLIMNVGTYFFSDKLALSSSGAKPLTQTEAPQIYTIVKELSYALKMPMPKLFRIPSPQANAFATGRSPQHASVAVTDGIMELLTIEELKGVLAHELGHVKNRDILIASIAAVLASVIAFVSRFGMYGGFRSRDSETSGGFGALGLVLALFAPLGASIVQMAVSREREYEADETGAEILQTGEPLARALEKIHGSVQQVPMQVNPAFSSLYIDNPMGGIGSTMKNLFSTHPPMQERVKRLKSMKFS